MFWFAYAWNSAFTFELFFFGGKNLFVYQSVLIDLSFPPFFYSLCTFPFFHSFFSLSFLKNARAAIREALSAETRNIDSLSNAVDQAWQILGEEDDSSVFSWLKVGCLIQIEFFFFFFFYHLYNILYDLFSTLTFVEWLWCIRYVASRCSYSKCFTESDRGCISDLRVFVFVLNIFFFFKFMFSNSPPFFFYFEK